MAPPNVRVQSMRSTNWVSISWEEIPSDQINGEHLGYLLTLKMIEKGNFMSLFLTKFNFWKNGTENLVIFFCVILLLFISVRLEKFIDKVELISN